MPICCQAARAAGVALPVTRRSQNAGLTFETLGDRVCSSWKLALHTHCTQSACCTADMQPCCWHAVDAEPASGKVAMAWRTNAVGTAICVALTAAVPIAVQAGSPRHHCLSRTRAQQHSDPRRSSDSTSRLVTALSRMLWSRSGRYRFLQHVHLPQLRICSCDAPSPADSSHPTRS